MIISPGDDAETALHHTLVAVTIIAALLAITFGSLVCGFAWGWEATGSGGGGCNFWVDFPQQVWAGVLDAVSFLSRCCCQCGRSGFENMLDDDHTSSSFANSSFSSFSSTTSSASASGGLGSSLLVDGEHMIVEGEHMIAKKLNDGSTDTTVGEEADASRFITPGGPLLPLIGSACNHSCFICNV